MALNPLNQDIFIILSSSSSENESGTYFNNIYLLKSLSSPASEDNAEKDVISNSKASRTGVAEVLLEMFWIADLFSAVCCGNDS